MPADPNFTLGFIDFPTGWWLAERVEHTDPRCSYAQTSGALLCDCGAIEAEFARRVAGLPTNQDHTEGVSR